MSYTPLPPGPLPLFCSECGMRMRESVAEMLPLDPQTGKGQLWRVTACPRHQAGNWGTRHHMLRWRAWYHDAFQIEPVQPEKDPGPIPGEGPSRVPWYLWLIGAIIGSWVIVILVVGLLMELGKML